MSDEQIQELEHCPMRVGNYPVHGQNVEQCVKEVIAASQAVFEQERRDGFIRVRIAHRALIAGKVKSKRDHEKL